MTSESICRYMIKWTVISSLKIKHCGGVLSHCFFVSIRAISIIVRLTPDLTSGIKEGNFGTEHEIQTVIGGRSSV